MFYEKKQKGYVFYMKKYNFLCLNIIYLENKLIYDLSLNKLIYNYLERV